MKIRLLQNITTKLRRSRYKRSKPLASKPGKKHPRLTTFIKSASIFALIVVVVVTVIYPLLKVIYSFELKNDKSAGVYNETKWDKESRVLILLAGLDRTNSNHIFVDSLYVMVLKHDQQDLVGIVGLNPDILVTYTEGKSTLRTIYNQEFSKDKGTEYLLRGSEQLIGASIDKYLLLDEEGFLEISKNMPNVAINPGVRLNDQDLKASGKSNLVLETGEQRLNPEQFLSFLASDVDGKEGQLHRTCQFIKETIRNADSIELVVHLTELLPSISTHVSTNITTSEFVGMFMMLRGVRSDQIKTAYVQNSSTLLAGHSGIYEVRTPVYERIDDDLETIFIDPKILEEQAKIEVLNGSSVFGLASSRARRISNTGARVVNVANNLEAAEMTTIYVENPELYPQTLQAIEKIFGYNVEYAKTGFKYKHVGDIIVVIGEQYE